VETIIVIFPDPGNRFSSNYDKCSDSLPGGASQKMKKNRSAND
jgi:hypothetical protein